MSTFTLDQAMGDLKGIIQKTIESKDETIIASNEGSVVMLGEDEWASIKETLRLLSDKESFSALLESHAIRNKGERPESISPDEAFKDVQNC